MSEFKGTPGPWKIQGYPDHPGFFDIRAKLGNRDWVSTFASVHTNAAVEQDPFETEPNACLIAAAPDLLEAALEETQGNHFDDCLCKLCRAIKKALGDE